MRRCMTLGLALSLLALPAVGAADWPQWGGPDRTAVSKETGLLKEWSKGGPKLLWKSTAAGLGYGSMAVADGVVYTMGARGNDEYLIALDDKGKPKWSTKIGPTFDWAENQWSKGPNATPTVDGDRIYALSSRGMLLCAGKADGKAHWRLDVVKDLGGQVNPTGGGYGSSEDQPEKLGWGYAGSPLVDGENVILLAGGPKGLFAAVDRKTGKEVWRSKAVKHQAVYGSPTAATIGGVRQYIGASIEGVFGVSAKDGELLWSHKHEFPDGEAICPTPVVQGNRVFFSVGYGGSGGCFCLELSQQGGKFKVAEKWRELTLNNRFGGVVLSGGHLYGYHEEQRWVCLKAEDGKEAWPRGRQPLRSGSVLAADGRLYVLAEAGSIAMLELSPKGFNLISQAKLPERSKNRKPRGGLWSHPSLSDGKLYVRDQELVFCFQVK